MLFREGAVMSTHTLLVAEDEPELLEIYRLWLERSGFTILPARNGREALDLCRKQTVDLVISDVRMADGGGIELARDLRVEMDSSPPLIFLTGYADISCAEAYELGACAIVGKPIDRQKLVAIVQNALKEPRERWAVAPADPVQHTLRKNFQSVESAVQSRDLSLGRGGLFVHNSTEPFNEDHPLEFDFQFNEGELEKINGAGIIRWHRVSSEQGMPPGLGIEIVHLLPPALQWIAELIGRRKPRAFIPMQ